MSMSSEESTIAVNWVSVVIFVFFSRISLLFLDTTCLRVCEKKTWWNFLRLFGFLKVSWDLRHSDSMVDRVWNCKHWKYRLNPEAACHSFLEIVSWMWWASDLECKCQFWIAISSVQRIILIFKLNFVTLVSWRVLVNWRHGLPWSLWAAERRRKVQLLLLHLQLAMHLRRPLFNSQISLNCDAPAAANFHLY
jgi:hypothetical protein